MHKLRFTVAVVSLTIALAINLAALYLHVGAQSTNKAGLVVQMKDGSVITRCVSFSETEITGYDLLRRSGLPMLVDASNGVSVCKIGASGCNFPAQQCFCDCQDLGQSCVYWIYYFQSNGAWKYSSFGPAALKVANGAVNGWVYGAGSASSSSVTPPLMSFDQICGAAVAQPTSTRQGVALPTNTPAPVTNTATALPQSPPSATPVPASPTVVNTVETIAQVTSTSLPEATPTVVASTATSTAVPSNTSVPSTATETLQAPTQVPSQVPSQMPSPTPTPVATPTQGSANFGNYVIFGVIAVGLGAALLFTRRNTGQRKP